MRFKVLFAHLETTRQRFALGSTETVESNRETSEIFIDIDNVRFFPLQNKNPKNGSGVPDGNVANEDPIIWSPEFKLFFNENLSLNSGDQIFSFIVIFGSHNCPKLNPGKVGPKKIKEPRARRDKIGGPKLRSQIYPAQ